MKITSLTLTAPVNPKAKEELSPLVSTSLKVDLTSKSFTLHNSEKYVVKISDITLHKGTLVINGSMGKFAQPVNLVLKPEDEFDVRDFLWMVAENPEIPTATKKFLASKMLRGAKF